MRCACRGEVSKSARLKWSPTVAILFRFTRIEHYKRRGCRDKGDGRFGDVRLCELHLAGQLCRRNDVVVAKGLQEAFAVHVDFQFALLSVQGIWRKIP